MIVVAMPEEIELVNGTVEQPIIVTGIGGLNVIHALRDVPRETPIYNVGYAGSNVLSVGTRCAIGTVRAFHPNAEFDDQEYSLPLGDTLCYTASDFVTCAPQTSEACVFDMELAYILALGFTHVYAEKVVSDNLSMGEYEKTKRGSHEKGTGHVKPGRPDPVCQKRKKE